MIHIRLVTLPFNSTICSFLFFFFFFSRQVWPVKWWIPAGDTYRLFSLFWVWFIDHRLTHSPHWGKCEPGWLPRIEHLNFLFFLFSSSKTGTGFREEEEKNTILLLSQLTRLSYLFCFFSFHQSFRYFIFFSYFLSITCCMKCTSVTTNSTTLTVTSNGNEWLVSSDPFWGHRHSWLITFML